MVRRRGSSRPQGAQAQRSATPNGLPSPCATLALQELLCFEGPGYVIDLDLI